MTLDPGSRTNTHLLSVNSALSKPYVFWPKLNEQRIFTNPQTCHGPGIIQSKKSRIRETKNLSTDEDSRTDTIKFFHQETAGDGRALRGDRLALPMTGQDLIM